MQAAATICEGEGLSLRMKRYNGGVGDSISSAPSSSVVLAVPTQLVEIEVPLLSYLATLPPSEQHVTLVSQALSGLVSPAGISSDYSSPESFCADEASSTNSSRAWYVDRMVWTAQLMVPRALSSINSST